MLIVSEDRSERSLVGIVLRDAFEAIEVLEAGDALEFAEQLASDGFRAALCAERLTWAKGVDVLATLKARFPDARTILLAPGDREPPPAVDVVVEPSSRGFLDLPREIDHALERTQRAERLGAAEAAYARLLEELPIGVYKMTAAGEIVACNAALCAILGFTPGAMVERHLPDLLADVDLRLSCRALLERGRARRELQAQMRRGDGGKVEVVLSFWPVSEPGDEGYEYEGTLWPLGAGSGAQFQFTHLVSAISHDLQDPLQLIAQYARLLIERHGEGLREGAVDLIGKLSDTAGRMQAMLDDLLEYSRVTLESRPFQVVDMRDVLADVLKNLDSAIGESGAEVTHRELGSVVGDPRQLRQLLQNLIGNAIKFTGDRAPRVAVKVEEREAEWLISVADNGIGVNAEAGDRIFDMFQRLHTDAEYPGRGMGLAICKRIAECHGGRIWVDSRPGEGATFFVTVSKKLNSSLSRGTPNRRAS